MVDDRDKASSEPGSNSAASSDHAAPVTSGPAPEGAASGAETSQAAVTMTGAERTQFECIKNAAYHDDRERHFARLHKFIMFVVVLSGTAAFGAIVGKEGVLASAFALLSTAAGVADLVFDLDGRARLHASLKRRCYDLLARAGLGEDSRAINAAVTRMYADEPPTMHSVNSVAFNAAVDALGRPAGQKYVLKPWQSVSRHWWPFRANEFPTIDECVACARSSRNVSNL
jgi:hypothetical protein